MEVINRFIKIFASANVFEWLEDIYELLESYAEISFLTQLLFVVIIMPLYIITFLIFPVVSGLLFIFETKIMLLIILSIPFQLIFIYLLPLSIKFIKIAKEFYSHIITAFFGGALMIFINNEEDFNFIIPFSESASLFNVVINKIFFTIIIFSISYFSAWLIVEIEKKNEKAD